MKFLSSFFLFCIATVLFLSCGEDRSGEQPFPPTVLSVGITVEGDSALMTGCVTASPNSSLRECGFEYGNDTLRATAKAAEPAENFTAITKPLRPGNYFAVAYAKNGMGTSYGDTLRFDIP